MFLFKILLTPLRVKYSAFILDNILYSHKKYQIYDLKAENKKSLLRTTLLKIALRRPLSNKERQIIY